jgi:hypothetical protein
MQPSLSSSFASAVVQLFELAKCNIPAEHLARLTAIRDCASRLDGLEAYIIPTISTAHLSNEELRLLDAGEHFYPGVWVSMTADAGPLLSFAEPEESTEGLVGEYPGTAALAEFAARNGIVYIRLDSDAETVDCLPVFDH